MKFFTSIKSMFADDSIKKTLSVSSFFSSIVFAALGVWIIPMGIIDTSILIWCAQLLLISAAYLGIKIDIDLSSRKFKSSCEERKEDKKAE